MSHTSPHHRREEFEETALEYLNPLFNLAPNLTRNRKDAGALVQEVVEDSAAAAAGLQIGDLITAIGGRPIRSSGDLRAEIISLSPGTPVMLTVVRDGVEITVRAVLGSATF